MTRQYDADLRTHMVQKYLEYIGPSPILQLRTGAQPSSTRQANSGTLLVQMTLPSTWMTVTGDGVIELAGTWSAEAVATGTPQHYRLFRSASPADCVEQGAVSVALKRTTSGSTPANGNVISLSSVASLAVGMAVSGIGVPSAATIAEVGASTVKINPISTAGIASAAAVYFGDTSGDLWVPSSTITAGVDVTITIRKLIYPGA